MTTKHTAPKPSRGWVCAHCHAFNVTTLCGCAASRLAAGQTPTTPTLAALDAITFPGGV